MDSGAIPADTGFGISCAQKQIAAVRQVSWRGEQLIATLAEPLGNEGLRLERLRQNQFCRFQRDFRCLRQSRRLRT